MSDLGYFFCGFFIAMYATKMWFWMDAYSQDWMLVESSKIASPTSWFAWHVSAMRRWDQKSFQEAVFLWTMAKMISPFEFKILFNLSTALKLGKHEKEAEEFLRMAENNMPPGQEEQIKKLISDWRAGNLSVVL